MRGIHECGAFLMELIRGPSNVRARHRGAIITLGSFDGLHLGHQALIRAARERGDRERRPVILLSFEPLPREYLQSADPPARLTNFRERWRILQPARLDALMLLRFDESLRLQSGAQFVELLASTLGVSALVVGHDFRFGREGEARADFLRSAGLKHGFSVDVIEPVLLEEERISSTALRQALAAGELERAQRLLGRPYSLRGRVVGGQQLGRTLGFPTANIRLRRRRSPLGGIFAVRVHGIDPEPRGGVASLGTRPTVGGVEPLLETFVFDFAGDLYGLELEVEFVAHLRAELRFESLELLVAQMRADEAAARERLARCAASDIRRK
jgi:riboflavin kinase/FMN adenylyltransferase